MLWVAGFDIVYAIQDIEFDREHGLHSLPARLGAHRSLVVARTFHLGAVAAFVAISAFALFPVGRFYALGVGMMATLLLIEHHIMQGPLDMQRIDRAFFKMNVLVSTSFFALTLLDRMFTS
jgi:4-hydroxybenzoate polyprenyltransferase